jgi:protein SCO1/2
MSQELSDLGIKVKFRRLAVPDRVHIKQDSAAARIGLAVVLIALFVLAAACGGEEPAELAGMVRHPAAEVGHVVLPDVADTSIDFTTRAEPGQLLLVYFGYLSCPDVCPTTLADLRRAVGGLGDDASRVDVAFITIDPDRDLPDEVASYIQVFFPEGIALRTADPAVLKAVADAYGAAYEVTTAADGAVEVAHSAFVYAVDANGTILVQWPFGMSSDDIRNDLAYLFDQAA